MVGEVTPICRAYFDRYYVWVEVKPGVAWYLPNPTPDGKTYNPEVVVRAVIAAKCVNLLNWRREG